MGYYTIYAEARVAAQQLWGYLPLAPRSNDLTNNAHPLFYHPANRGSRPVQPICSGITNHFQPEARKDRQMHWKFTRPLVEAAAKAATKTSQQI